jgi:hypothetical protein
MAPMKLSRNETFGFLMVSAWLSTGEVSDIGKLIDHDDYTSLSHPSENALAKDK